MLRRIFIQGLVAVLICSCEGKIGPAGKNSLVNIVDEAPGSNCPNGGQRIESGIDEDANGLLSSGEISITKFICNGKNSITVYTDEPAGSNCSNSGFKIQVGIDQNGNLALDPSEVQSTKYLCVPGDKQERLEIGAPNFGTRSTSFVLGEFMTYHLIKFNKLNYPAATSITFVPSMFAGLDAMFPGQTTICYVELFNVTDNQSIVNSQLQSTVNDYVFGESPNLLSQLPNKEITLGIRIKSGNANLLASTGIRSYLFIYKN